MAAADERPSDIPAPGTPTRRLRAQSQRDFELEFFSRILEKDPLFTAVLRVHANNLSAAGQYARALQMDRRIVRLQPDRPVPWYNFACSFARMGMIDPAFTALHRALDLGYHHFRHLARDPDLESLRSDPRFTRLFLRKPVNGE
jgi:Flp pilus assembly protein TadD